MTPTITATATVSNTPNASLTPSCGQQVVNIYDERGEKVATVCGNVSFPAGTNFTMTLSSFSQNPNGPGGTISIFLNGQWITTWNAAKDDGSFVPNAFYHFVLQENTGNGNTIQIERDAFISTYHGEAVAFVGLPNVARAGDTVKFTASFAGTPGTSQSKIKIYSMDGELLQTLDLDGTGSATWDLKNAEGSPVASGLYIALLDGVDPTSGQGLTKTIKLLVTH
jgi:hypothetical protein